VNKGLATRVLLQGEGENSVTKKEATFLVLLLVFCTGSAIGQDQPTIAPSGGHEPPPQAYEDCKGKKAGDAVQHATRGGLVAATCVESPKGLVARPNQPPDAQRVVRPGEPAAPEDTSPRGKATRYSIEQATSDRAQLDTIAFDGLAFLTGDFGSDTFLPPGKVSDYFGFQYMRDVDANEDGHNTSFLTRIAENMLAVLNDDQKAQLVDLGKEQRNDIRLFAQRRFVLIKAFRQNLSGEIPVGSKGLDKSAVMKYSAELYALDGKLAFRRAQVMAAIIRSLSDDQRAALARLKFGDSRTWPDVPEQLDRRSMSHDLNVAVMTYSSEMFSWYRGSVKADTYFCPERHGMYFGGFGMKTAPAMGKQNYSISTSLTRDSGEAFLSVLNNTQRTYITELTALQRADLQEIVNIRRSIAGELRRFLTGDTADEEKVVSLAKRYGELDGEISYYYGTAFAKIGQTLTEQQKSQLASLRPSNPGDPRGPFLYSTPMRMPQIASTDSLFDAGTAPKNGIPPQPRNSKY
jgi:Spy/CpxP family protein refolding chaperone